MNQSSTSAACSSRYELRFTGLFNRGRGYAFPCNAEGRVEIDELSEQGRNSYLYARMVVGRELSPPVVACIG